MTHENYDIQTSVSIKFLEPTNMHLFLCTVCSCFCMTKAQVSSCYRGHMAHRNIYDLALYRKSLQTPVLLHQSPLHGVRQAHFPGMWGSSPRSARRNHRPVQGGKKRGWGVGIKIPSSRISLYQAVNVHPLESELLLSPTFQTMSPATPW